MMKAFERAYQYNSQPRDSGGQTLQRIGCKLNSAWSGWASSQDRKNRSKLAGMAAA